MPGRMNRLLSYQLVVLNRLTGPYTRPHLPRRSHEKASLFAEEIAHRSAQRGAARRRHRKVSGGGRDGGHFLRADLCACSDWAFGTIAGSKERSTSGAGASSNVRSTRFAGHTRRQLAPLSARSDRPTAAKAPRSRSCLSTRRCSRRRILAEGARRVDRRREDRAAARPDRAHGRAVARRSGAVRALCANDAIIAAKYLDLTWSALEKNFAIGDHKPTLGSVGVEMIKREVANLGLTPDDYFGYRREGESATTTTRSSTSGHSPATPTTAAATRRSGSATRPRAWRSTTSI